MVSIVRRVNVFDVIGVSSEHNRINILTRHCPRKRAIQ